MIYTICISSTLFDICITEIDALKLKLLFQLLNGIIHPILLDSDRPGELRKAIII